MKLLLRVFLCLLVVVANQFSQCASMELSATAGVVLDFGPSISSTVQSRVHFLLSQVPSGLASNDLGLTLSFGNTSTSRQLIDEAEIRALEDEGFIIRSKLDKANNSLIIAGWGQAGGPSGSSGLSSCVRGSLYAVYETLELIGFRFLKPLSPLVPEQISIDLDALASLNVKETPYWKIRAWELHTQHPIELADVLNGWSQNGYENKTGWQAMLPDVEKFVEWLVANKQNRYMYNLLMSDAWMEFADSIERQSRLKQITDLSHDYCIGVGGDAPIAFVQQHGFTLIRSFGSDVPLSQQIQEIHDHLDWYAGAGYDFLPTESGLSEFTHPDDVLMLTWMNATATYAQEKHGLSTLIKVHCSTGQYCKHYNNSHGQPLNFNFLPSKAVTDMGIMPHTVQFYALDDYAPVYGNTNFTYMENFMFEQAATSNRENVWYPETEYWVSFDSPVPLFLPLYAQRRLHDLRHIAEQEVVRNARIDGQLNFDSGWEWGYWLNSFVTARAAWNPHMELSEDEAMINALRPLTSLYTKPIGDGLTSLLMTIMTGQYTSFIAGQPINATLTEEMSIQFIQEHLARMNPNDKNMTWRSGVSYIEGYDSFADLSTIAPSLTVAPVRLPMRDLISDERARDFYNTTGRDLLHSMSTEFSKYAVSMTTLYRSVPTSASPNALFMTPKLLLSDLVDSMNITSVRSTQVYQLYEFLYSKRSNQQALEAAQLMRGYGIDITARREKEYSVNLDRIAGWREGPTCYSYTYLWTVHSGYFMYRDELQATTEGFFSPCTMNIQFFLREFVDFHGETSWLELMEKIREWLAKSPLHSLTDCLAPPSEEPRYPPPSLS